MNEGSITFIFAKQKIYTFIDILVKKNKFK